MNKTLLPGLAALMLLTVPAAAQQVAIGETAQLTQGTNRYTGILVKPNALAPCNAKSAADDIVFDVKVDKLVTWSKPCPRLPRWIGPAAVATYLKSANIDLGTAYTMTSQRAPISPGPP